MADATQPEPSAVPSPSPAGGPADLATPERGRPDALSPEDAAALADAVKALEGTSFAANLSGLVGRQLGFAGDLLPARVTEAANKAAGMALKVALRGAVRSLSGEERPPQNRLHLAAGDDALAALLGHHLAAAAAHDAVLPGLLLPGRVPDLRPVVCALRRRGRAGPEGRPFSNGMNTTL